MLFITSDIKVLATLINVEGEKTVISYQFRTAKRGMFKEEMERQILKTLNSNNKENNQSESTLSILTYKR